MTYQNTLYLIENHTPMHVGSGDANFGTVDRLIQRDVLTGYPVVHSSSLKGALKEYVDYRHEGQAPETLVQRIFGDEERAGQARFIDARFLAVPMRSDKEPFFMCTSPTAIRDYLETSELFGIEIPDRDRLRVFADYRGGDALARREAQVETIKVKKNTKLDFDALERLVGEPAAIVPDALFVELLRDLPVIARNQLDNGESKNLWYEEVLPRKSRLFTVVSLPTHLNEEDAKSLQNAYEKFKEYLSDEEIIQLGANASVGYGVCTFTEVGHA